MLEALGDPPSRTRGQGEKATRESVVDLRVTKDSNIVNDPSAGSPTETLLRLLLPLNAQVWESSRHTRGANLQRSNPNTSLKRSIGSSDGRCVQRAGT